MSFEELEMEAKSPKQSDPNFTKHLHLKQRHNTAIKTLVTHELDQEPEIQNSKVTFNGFRKPNEVNPALFVKSRKSSPEMSEISGATKSPHGY